MRDIVGMSCTIVRLRSRGSSPAHTVLSTGRALRPDTSHEPSMRRRVVLTNLVPVVSAAFIPLGVGAAGGGYFPSSWAWIGMGCLWLAALAIAARSEFVVAPPVLFAALLWAFAMWALASAIWADASVAVVDAERDVLYAVAVTTVLLLRRALVGHALAGLVIGVTLLSCYSLATRLFPERFGGYDSIAGYRLAGPVGYWNALGIL